MGKIREKIFMAVTVILCVLLFAERLTGDIWHAVFGVLLIVTVVGHMFKQKPKMQYQKPAVRILDQVLVGALIVLFVTGMLLHPLQGVLVLKILHKLAAVVLVLGIIGHIAQHRTKA